MLATILISNYNYARYVGEAIDSALRQTYDEVEVVVVDDGSTDDSRAVIGSYGELIKPVFKENGGLASAVNAGYAASRGELICFLDADDVFAPTKVEKAVRAYENSGACMVYHQLQRVNAERIPDGKPTPREVFSGDIRRRVERAGGWFPLPVTSGLAFSRSYLNRLLPMPTGPGTMWPDTYLASPAPFVGTIAGLREPLGFNRVHGANSWTVQAAARDSSELAKRRDQVRFEFEVLERTLASLGIQASLSLEDHLRYQQYSWAAGGGAPFLKAASTLARCPTLPLSMKWRELARWILRRW